MSRCRAFTAPPPTKTCNIGHAPERKANRPPAATPVACFVRCAPCVGREDGGACEGGGHVAHPRGRLRRRPAARDQNCSDSVEPAMPKVDESPLLAISFTRSK